MKYNIFTVKYLLSCSMSVVLTVKVEGLIEPPLAQMASTKACYKLGLRSIYIMLKGLLFPFLKIFTFKKCHNKP